jgi:hypothetical protein
MTVLQTSDEPTKVLGREDIQEQLGDSSAHDASQNDLESGDIDIAQIERIYRYGPDPLPAIFSVVLNNLNPSLLRTVSFSRKIDLRIIPAFWVLYFLCSAIRSNVGLAQTMNAESGHDLGSVLNATPHQISTGLALFYVCYVVFDLPSNLIMTKLSPHVWMSRIVIGVGIIGSCMAAMKAAWSL